MINTKGEADISIEEGAEKVLTEGHAGSEEGGNRGRRTTPSTRTMEKVVKEAEWRRRLMRLYPVNWQTCPELFLAV